MNNYFLFLFRPLAASALLLALAGCAQVETRTGLTAGDVPAVATKTTPTPTSAPVAETQTATATQVEDPAIAEVAALIDAPPPTVATPPITELAASQCAQPYDLWERIRLGFELEHPAQTRISTELQWFADHPGYLDRVAGRAQPFLRLVLDEVETLGLPSELALLPVVESAFQPFAYSHGRAAGLWQFVPGTGRRFGLKQDWWYDGRRDVLLATRAALRYLSYLHDFFDGDWLLALAAYNAGEGTVKRAVERNQRKHRPIDFWSLDLPPETEGYVPKLLAIAKLVDNPPLHGVVLPPIDDIPYLIEVDVGGQIDMALVAELADMELDELYRYNPAFNRWATHPEGPFHLLIPEDRVERLTAALLDLPPEKRIHWKRHRIASGETLITIANKYRTTVQLLKQVNGLRGSSIRAGSTLLIPVARKQLNEYSLTASARQQSIQSQSRQGHRTDYQVRPGDTFWSIARQFDVGITELAKWNGMAPRDTLRTGQKLVIWTNAPVEKSAYINPADFVHPFSDKATQRIGYTVRKGDSLARISQRFNVSVGSLARWNRLDPDKLLKPGQRLTLYVDVTSLADI